MIVARSSRTADDQGGAEVLDNRISLQKLEIFCLVVELGGVGRAAEHLMVAQPVISSHLKSLRQRLPLEIFERDGRNLRLTEAGESAYAWAKDVLGRTEKMTREIDGIAHGEVGRASVSSNMTPWEAMCCRA